MEKTITAAGILRELGAIAFARQTDVLRRSYFLSGEKVCKEPPGNFRRFPGPFGRPKGEVDRCVLNRKIFNHFPLRYPLGKLCGDVFLEKQ